MGSPGTERRSAVWGALSPLGLGAAAAVFLVDQAHKAWMIHVYAIGERGRVAVTPFLDLVMVWNPGISYGLLPQDSAAGRLALIAFAVAAVGVLAWWLAGVGSRLAALAIGLIMGGALGNALDRLVYGAVADFFFLHYGGFAWYVFNIADVAIVAGVAGLLLDWMFSGHKKVSKDA